jgi:hypothetical protein
VRRAAKQFEGIPTALFQGNYRSQGRKLLSKPPGRFTVQVFDNGEPGTGVGIFQRLRLPHLDQTAEIPSRWGPHERSGETRTAAGTAGADQQEAMKHCGDAGRSPA